MMAGLACRFGVQVKGAPRVLVLLFFFFFFWGGVLGPMMFGVSVEGLGFSV